MNPGTNNSLAFTNAATVHDTSHLTLPSSATLRWRLTEPKDTNSVDYTISKTTVHVSGPVATTLKAKSAGDFSKRVLNLFNPFSSQEPNLPPTVSTASGPVNTRAWSTIVGWSPGQSAFPDEHYHEPPQLRLMSVNVEKQP
ncbi:MAG TPA: hypothetical protein VFE51_20645 [Verrucomicrobiae bacterium]|nr:hypothetical protein [Verrucomicrobiae bacterium]